MMRKWIKAIFTKPLVILKSIYFRNKGINERLARKRLTICKKCIIIIINKMYFTTNCILYEPIKDVKLKY